MPLLLFVIGAVVVGLAHIAPAPFVLEILPGNRSVWRGPREPGQRVVYLTFDDGPNPAATPQLLDVLAREQVVATFFVIPAHVNEATASIIRRAQQDGHGIGLHSHTRALMLDSPDRLRRRLEDHARLIESTAGAPPCKLFRPHAGWRGGQMYAGLAEAGYTLAGWGFGNWDFNWWRAPKPAALADRLARGAADGDIFVLHDGHHVNPRADRQHTVAAIQALIPLLKGRGFQFRSLCDAVSRSGSRG